ncbi:MAG: hypothetical protein KAH30_07050, partial [Caldisericia bacterium]|nr:hypothetical protein [Caldisericia bacterium]
TANGEEFNYESGNGNVSNSGDSFRAISQSFAVDSKGNPYIIWLNIYDKTSKSRRVSYITWNRKSWVNGYGEEYIPELEDSLSTRTFSNAEISGDFYARNPMILIDSEDNPCIIWNYYESESEHCRTNYSEGVYIKKADDGWVTINDENWNPELGNGRLNYKICDFTSLNHFDLDAHNKPYLTWINYSKSDAMFIALIKGEKNIWKTINGDKWDKTGSNCLLDVLRMQTNMKPPEIGVSSIIKIDTFNSIHLLWHYDIHKHIDGKYTRITHMFYSKWDGENWRTIDGQICNASSKNYGLVFATSSEHETLLERDLFIDKDNIPHIFWIFSGGSLNYIKGVQVK